MDLVREEEGKAKVVEMERIHFSHIEAANQLRNALANAFAKNWEGLVMKCIDDPYINFERFVRGEHRSHFTKMKKRYFEEVWDAFDLVIVGSGYSDEEATALKMEYNLDAKPVRSRFYLACLTDANLERPCFRVTNVVNSYMGK